MENPLAKHGQYPAFRSQLLEEETSEQRGERQEHSRKRRTVDYEIVDQTYFIHIFAVRSTRTCTHVYV